MDQNELAAFAAMIEEWHSSLPPADAAKYARLTERLRASLAPAQSPAPAWKREAPKEEGFYWTRVDEDDRYPVVGEFEAIQGGARRWYFAGIVDAEPWHAREHWPVRLEPPK